MQAGKNQKEYFFFFFNIIEASLKSSLAHVIIPSESDE